MRILIPTHTFTDSPLSGLNTVIWNTARCLGAQGHEVHVVSTWTDLQNHDRDALKQRNITVHTLADFPVHNLNRIVALRCFLGSIGLMLRKRFDWVYVIDTTPTPYHRVRCGSRLAVRLLAPATEEVTKLVTTGDWLFDRKRKDAEEGWQGRRRPCWYRTCGLLLKLLSPILYPKELYQGANIAFCQGQDTVDYWKERLPIPVVELPNGIEQDVFQERRKPPRQTNRFVYLFVGRIAKRKGLFRLLNAFSKMRESDDDIELWICGKGSEELLQEMEGTISKDPDHIFSFGEIKRNDIAPFFHHCSCLVDPMIYQGFSTVALEGLYCNKPVIVSRFGGTRDIVEDGYNGLLVDPREEDELRQAMTRLKERYESFREAVERNHDELAKDYSWEAIIDRFSDTLLAYEDRSPQ